MRKKQRKKGDREDETVTKDREKHIRRKHYCARAEET